MSMMYDDGLHQQVMGRMEADLGPEQKVRQESVNYREAADQATSCLTCANFLPEDNLCMVVEGEVSAGGVCDEHEPTDEGVIEDDDGRLG